MGNKHCYMVTLLITPHRTTHEPPSGSRAPDDIPRETRNPTIHKSLQSQIPFLIDLLGVYTRKAWDQSLFRLHSSSSLNRKSTKPNSQKYVHPKLKNPEPKTLNAEPQVEIQGLQSSPELNGKTGALRRSETRDQLGFGVFEFWGFGFRDLGFKV